MSSNEVPTEKQYEYVERICKELDRDLPPVFSKKAYSEFIETFENDYKLSLQLYHLEEDDDDY